jgi:hypothetical protein
VVVQVEEAVQASVVPDRVLDRSLADTDPEVVGMAHFAGLAAAGLHPSPGLTGAGR